MPLCPQCGKTVTRLTPHMRTHTGAQPFICDTCGQGFSQQGNLSRHMHTHTGAQPYVCDICGKGFTYSSSLVIHIRTHTGIQPYVCNTCGKGFTASSHLARHKRTHTGVLPYVCNTCGKGFSTSYHLTRHIHTHTGARPYVCTICGKGSITSDDLAKHMLTHTGTQPYVCDTCGKGFSQRGNLTRHMRTHTGVQSSPAASTTSSSPPGSLGRDPASRPATPFDAPGFRSPSPFQFMAPGEFLSGQRADTPFSQPGNLSRHTGPQSGDSTFSALSPGSPGRGPASRPATTFDAPGFRSPSPFHFMEPGEFLSGQRPDSPFHRKK